MYNLYFVTFGVSCLFFFCIWKFLIYRKIFGFVLLLDRKIRVHFVILSKP